MSRTAFARIQRGSFGAGVDHGPNVLEGVHGDARGGQEGDRLLARQGTRPGGVGRLEQCGVVRLLCSCYFIHKHRNIMRRFHKNKTIHPNAFCSVSKRDARRFQRPRISHYHIGGEPDSFHRTPKKVQRMDWRDHKIRAHNVKQNN